jgi:hypothetical protein
VAKAGGEAGLIKRLTSGLPHVRLSEEEAQSVMQQLPKGCVLLRTCSLKELVGTDPAGAVIRVPPRFKLAIRRVLREADLLNKYKRVPPSK